MNGNEVILGKPLDWWTAEYPLLVPTLRDEPVFWLNPKYHPDSPWSHDVTSRLQQDILHAEQRLQRFAPHITAVFPETATANGIIESPLIEINKMKAAMESAYGVKIKGRLLLKCDSHLPISGSIKARGGIYAVLTYAESLAIQAGMLTHDADYSLLAQPRFKDLFARYTLLVCSTGNLGLSIGLMGRTLGFTCEVHMSHDAAAWKKDRLRAIGATVIEYPCDYSTVMGQARERAEGDPYRHFIDDENSKDLFMGYAVAGMRLPNQLDQLGIRISPAAPLLVNLPCGVGGGPGGVATGLHATFGDNVHCFFAEPTQAPCMLLGLMTGLHDGISTSDFGIEGKTAADGLNVARPSAFVGKAVERIINGCYTIQDQEMFRFLKLLTDSEGKHLEPSAVVGFRGVVNTSTSPDYAAFAQRNQINMDNAIHIVWATGGSMVPPDVMQGYYSNSR